MLRQRAGAKHKDVPQVLPLQQPGSDEEDAAELSDASTIVCFPLLTRNERATSDKLTSHRSCRI